MRALILVLSVLGIVVGAHSAEAGLSATPRETLVSVDTATLTDVTNRRTEDRIGLSKTKRREVQRRLTSLGFGTNTKINGKFDDSTRDAIARWQEEHAYPKTGFLNTAQHEALLSEGATEAGKFDHQDRRRAGARAHYSRRAGGPIGAIGGAVHHVVGGVVGLFRR
jgi:peptidoglycan hydrolase-like protein with peptidoglycan-binding domain